MISILLFKVIGQRRPHWGSRKEMHATIWRKSFPGRQKTSHAELGAGSMG